jgi:hypothetical protein
MVKVPFIVNVRPTVKVVAFVPPIVRLRQVEVAPIDGWFAPVKFASPKMALVVAVGTPFVQLLAVLQAVLVVPFQLVVVCAERVNTLNTSVAINSKIFFIRRSVIL